MTDKFEIGEIAVLVGLAYYPELNGTECTILDGPRQKTTFGWRSGVTHDGIQYRVETSFGDKGWVLPQNLRKKKPPRREIDQVTTWDKVLWRPREVEHA